MFDPIAYINEPRWAQSRPGLERIRELMGLLGNPQENLRFVHVAGTNGKGSTSTYIASILQAAGYRTGLFTSPFVVHFCDRIKIDGREISIDELHEVTCRVKEQADTMADHPTEFELMSAVAFLYFAQQGCEIVVAEVGMGGRLDSTNIIKKPEVCVITAIAFDHEEFLGDSLAKIAGEKAGIIKRGAAVVTWPQKPEAGEVIVKAAAERGCEVSVPDFGRIVARPVELRTSATRSFDYKGLRGLETKMLAHYQVFNAALAVEAIRALHRRGWTISEEALRTGLQGAFLPGRFEVLGTDPFFILDGSHNADGTAALCRALEEAVPGKKGVFILGVLADKDYRTMIERLVPLASAFVTVTPPVSRALSAAALAEEIRSISSVETFVAVDIRDSIEKAVALVALADDLPPDDNPSDNPPDNPSDDPSDNPSDGSPYGTFVCATGSLYSLAEFKRVL